MPSYQDILNIASATIDTLKEIGVDNCCFIGGMACMLYTGGQGRQPNDLDVLCLTPYQGGAEGIKEQLCQANNQFYTVPAQNSNNRWNVLWFWWDTNNNPEGYERFKVDILVPGVLDLPYVHPSYIVHFGEFPAAPLHLLLLHKLKGWDDRHYSRRPDQRAKIPDDVQDIKDLLSIADSEWPELNITTNANAPYIADRFHNASCVRVGKFIRERPDGRWLFRGVGEPQPIPGGRGQSF